MIRTGGKNIYGAPIGILMLQSRFPRVPGDMGHAGSWPFPVLYHVVEAASPDLVVRQGAEGLLPRFIAGAERLVAHGAEMITTNCGFLARFQAEMAAELQVPVATSALMQVPFVQAVLPPGRRVGVITISAADLTQDLLTKAGCPPGTPIVGTDPDGAFATSILDDCESLDIAATRRELLAAAKELMAGHPDLGAIVLECTNMPPYQADLQAATGLPVFSIIDYVRWLHGGLRPAVFCEDRSMRNPSNSDEF